MHNQISSYSLLNTENEKKKIFQFKFKHPVKERRKYMQIYRILKNT